jgi:hypothetical protein
MEADSEAPHDYRLFGLALRSTVALPELESCARDDTPAVEIALGAVDYPGDDRGDPEPLVATGFGVVLTVTDVARFCISEGRRIIVQPDPAASGRNVRLFLLGSAMGVLLHQRGILPLHANAIDIDGGAIAFMGKSGAGKSTLAAAFHDSGRGILSDDVCAVIHDGTTFVAQPGIPRLRLWRDAVERSGRAVDAYERAFDALDKYTVGTDLDARPTALPIKAIYLLERDDSGAGPEIRRLSGIAAVQALIENTYRGSFIPLLGDSRVHFETCLALNRAVPIFALSRPWDADVLGATMARVQEHVRSLAAAAG